ncbi:hypothetical protein QW131_02880 [Roseibium salinum]|nr:hypothetical protein [Roseibium salinum]
MNDSGNIITMHGDTDYDATVEASRSEPYIALKLQLPPDLLAETLIRFVETGTQAGKTETDATFFSASH